MGPMRILATMLTMAATAVSTGDTSDTPRYTYTSKGIEYCKVHQTRLKEDTVVIFSGTWVPDPKHRQARLELFPNTNDFLSSCMGSDEENADVLYCPACRLAQAAYYERLHEKREQKLLDKIKKAKDIKSWRGEYGETLLHLAAIDGFTEIAKTLLDRRCDVNAGSTDGQTPLHWACADDYVETAQLLIEAGAYVNVRDDDNDTPLHWAPPPIAKLLLKHGAQINPVNVNGETPLALAKFMHPENIDFHEYLEDAGAYYDPNFITLIAECPPGDNQKSRKLLYQAVELGEFNAVKELITGNIDVNVLDEHKQTLLHKAVLFNWDSPRFDASPNLHLIQLLIDSGINVNARNAKGQTALHLAVSECPNGAEARYVPIFKALLAGGADVTIKDNKKRTPFTEIEYDPRVVRLMIHAGADLNIESQFGGPLIFKAVSDRDVELVKLMVKAGANVNIQPEHDDPLIFHAILFHNPQMVEFLIKAGVDLKTKNDNGHTPLEYARAQTWDFEHQLHSDPSNEEQQKARFPQNIKKIIQLLQSHGQDK